MAAVAAAAAARKAAARPPSVQQQQQQQQLEQHGWDEPQDAGWGSSGQDAGWDAPAAPATPAPAPAPLLTAVYQSPGYVGAGGDALTWQQREAHAPQQPVRQAAASGGGGGGGALTWQQQEGLAAGAANGSSGGGSGGGSGGAGQQRRPRHQTPCKFYPLGRCQRGAACAFRHDEPAAAQELRQQRYGQAQL
ncbi:hypothetical protein MNEG_13262 [Monoraphidium neglectum]|uniref:C3H1-type domain-containing protein n=1 Tax=Monoraphidium neglectum TaxID=145388 RepID=A0A0D2KFN4_9CHLO|nr:hypothetical protein MNEG_13262 [Monoraphidium neglectum]KIY94698.1 hypothetical protein MNEG_13262 [Monoraphidium neglectum]|eukprot:XP_013893718.1 hypothetical protein MNEG_13262 [Monoraphidium neglectum]